MDPVRLEQRLAEFIERRENGEALSPETFASEHGEGGSELLAALRALASTEALFPARATDLPARVGPYRVRGEIGRGGMGRVLEVRHPEHPEQVLALKLLHVTLAHEPRALERFRREGKALERIHHPWIVRVHEAGLIDARPFLVMERVEGASLAEWLRRARERQVADQDRSGASFELLELPGEGEPLERILRLVARLARAMAAAHREGVLHRDLNPRNVLVRPGGEPVIIDFGLMRASGAPTLTGSGDLLGTPQYLSPEQARGERVDERSDLFGLGTILWELLTLAPPRAADDTLALVRQASTRPLLPARALTRRLPRGVAIVLRRATSFFPRWRYASCEALATDLERLLEDEPIRARPPGLVQRSCERIQAHRLATGLGAALLLALGVGLLLRHRTSADDLERQRIQGMNAVVRPWLDGEREPALAALAAYRRSESEPPFLEFLEGLITDDLERDARDPATRALLEGERLRREGEGHLARARFDTAWDIAPGYPMVVLLRGLASLEAGEPEAARGALEMSANSFGRSPRLHRALATVYEALELPEDTARALDAALALRPGDAEAWLALARARTRLGEGTRAVEAAKRALELEPEAMRGPVEELARSWSLDAALARELRTTLPSGAPPD